MSSAPYQIRYIHGEKVLESPEAFYIVIRTPFVKAGTIYGWKGPSVGIGVSIDLLNLANTKGKKIRVLLGSTNDRYYEADPKHWSEFAAGKQSYQNHKRGPTPLPWLAVMQFTVPQNFKRVDGDFKNLKRMLLTDVVL